MSFLGFTLDPPYSIIIPYAQNGSLYQFTKSHTTKPRLSPTQNTLIAIGVAYGMSRLHKANVIHRDLKSLNVLLDGRYLPFIADYGIARVVDDAHNLMTRDCGSSSWMAPEQMMSSTYDNKVDVYSYGCVLYEMLCHCLPWEGKSSGQIAASVTSGQRPPLPKAAAEEPVAKLIKKCWEQQPKHRPTFTELFKDMVHGKYWFKGTEERGVHGLKKFIKDLRSREPGHADHHESDQPEGKK
jgi:serine/threonine protein kinase